MEKRQINIALASDHTYAPQLEACAISVLSHNKNNAISFKILDNGMTDEDIICLSETIQKRGGMLQIYDVKNIEQRMGFLPPYFQNSLGAYCRIFLPELLPEYDKILYLDCDIIVRDDLGKMWENDIDEYYIGACKDTVPVKHKQDLGLRPEDLYINSGMLLINLKLWRKDQITQKIIKCIDNIRDTINLPDQDAINIVCRKIKILEAKYNVMSPAYLMPYENIIGYFNVSNYYSEEEINRAKREPCIIHFTGYPDARPWEKECHHPLKKVFWKYQKEGNIFLEKNKDVGDRRIRRKLRLLKFRFLPYDIYNKIWRKQDLC